MTRLSIATRWKILALLFVVRMTMAMQFQMVAALSPAFEDTFAIGPADIGLLIGLYFAPGIVIAIPGGAVGGWIGEKRAVLAALVMMLAGGALMATGSAWEAQIAGRVLSGVGGVIINVLLTKMVTDWFAGKEISLALAVFLNSWPVGIAVALVALPLVAAAGGLAAGLFTVLGLVALACLGMAVFYRAPSLGVQDAPKATTRPRGYGLAAVLAAGAIWGLYNAALAMLFSFGPQFYVERGMSLAAAGSTTSLILWCLAMASPVAGYVADRTGWRLGLIVIGNLGLAGCVMAAALTGTSTVLVIAMGLFSGVAVGPMVSLPSLVLPPTARAFGMGLFFTVYYVCIAAGPIAAGRASEAFGIEAAFWLAAATLNLTVMLVPLFAWLAVQAPKSGAPQQTGETQPRTAQPMPRT